MFNFKTKKMDFNNEDWTLESNGQKIIILTAISRKFIFRCDSNPYNDDLTKHITNLHNNRDKFNLTDNKTESKYNPQIEKLEPIVTKKKTLFGSRILGLLLGKL